MCPSRPVHYLVISFVVVLSGVWRPAPAADSLQIDLAWALEMAGESGKFSGVLALKDGKFDGYLRQGVGSAQLSGEIGEGGVEMNGQIKAEPGWKARRFKVTIPMNNGTAASKFQTGGGVLGAGGAGGEFDVDLTVKIH